METVGAIDMVMVKEQFLIDAQLAQAILDYLAQRPYREVHQLIALLQRLEVAPEPQKPAGTIDDPLATPPHTPAKVQNV